MKLKMTTFRHFTKDDFKFYCIAMNQNFGMKINYTELYKTGKTEVLETKEDLKVLTVWEIVEKDNYNMRLTTFREMPKDHFTPWAVGIMKMGVPFDAAELWEKGETLVKDRRMGIKIDTKYQIIER